MYYCFDANAVYTYFGRENLNMISNKKIDTSLFKRKMNNANIIIPSCVLIEMVIHFRDNQTLWDELSGFITKNSDRIQIIQTGTFKIALSNGKIPLLLCPIIDWIVPKLLEAKINDESAVVYMVLSLITCVYLKFCIYKKSEKEDIDDIVVESLKQYDQNKHDEILRRIKNEIKKGYDLKDKHCYLKQCIDSLLYEMCRDIWVLSEILLNIKPKNEINEKILQQLFISAEQEIKKQGKNNDSLISQKIALDLEIDSDFIKSFKDDIFVNVLINKGYNRIQAQYAYLLFENWALLGKKIKKNDIYDWFLLGCLGNEQILFNKAQPSLPNHVIDYRLALITFDEEIQKFLKIHHPLSYKEIKQFYF